MKLIATNKITILKISGVDPGYLNQLINVCVVWKKQDLAQKLEMEGRGAIWSQPESFSSSHVLENTKPITLCASIYHKLIETPILGTLPPQCKRQIRVGNLCCNTGQRSCPKFSSWYQISSSCRWRDGIHLGTAALEQKKELQRLNSRITVKIARSLVNSHCSVGRLDFHEVFANSVY